VRQLYTLLALLIPAAADLCPIFTDLALFSPALGAVRLLVPPYWLWLIPQAPLLWALGALLLCLGGLGALALRYRLVEKYRLF